jgi:hypothetical protein
MRRYDDVVVVLAIEPAHRGKATWPDTTSPTAVLTPEQADELMDLIGIPPVSPLPSASG